MPTYSTREAAKQLGISGVALGRYIKTGKVNPPRQTVRVGIKNVHAWTDSDIERVRKLLPKIANGRKTRYQKLREKQKKTPARTSQPQHAKTARAGGPGPVPHKPKKKK